MSENNSEQTEGKEKDLAFSDFFKDFNIGNDGVMTFHPTKALRALAAAKNQVGIEDVSDEQIREFGKQIINDYLNEALPGEKDSE